MDRRHCLCLVLIPLFSLPNISIFSQSSAIQAHEVSGFASASLNAQFKDFTVYQIDSRKLVSLVRDEGFDQRVNLNLPGHGLFEIDLFESPIIHENYVLTIASEDGIEHRPWNGVVKAFRGNLTGGQYVVSLTIDENFVYGFIQRSGKDELRIEPLYVHLKGAQPDTYIVYRKSDAIDSGPRGCEVKYHNLHQNIHSEQDHEPQQLRVAGDCRTVEIAYANDWLMYDDHGNNVANVENHNIGVMNDSQNNYDDEFADDLIFEIVQIWVSTCSSCDPWTSSTNAGALLDDFRDWGQGGGFSNSYDVADLWTDRDFNGPTIGVSWVDAACSSFRYLTTQDFTGNGNLLRCLLSHELGHNFGSNHDAEGSPTIMAPSVQNTNTWSSSSINQINNYIDDINCLSICTSVQAPIADFSADETEGCDPFAVHFFDDSSGPPTSWEWTFPGGSPSSSTQQNPTVTYNTPGTYDVILEVSNSAGSNTLVRTDYITVLESPIADFTYSQNGLTLQFNSLSENAQTWFWDFGDGFTSNQENPFHTYGLDGEYEVTLTVTNDCGEDEYTILVEVFVAPEAGFSYSTDQGCAPLQVQFINESSDNAQFFEWFFPGGTPSFSTLENPIVTYSEPGFYDVTLIVENIAGLDELTINNLIEVAPQSEADFNFSVNGLSVQFVNASVDADSYLWIFGDGNTSTAESPNHTYESGGTYQVMLISSNACDPDTAFATISINSAPVADFVYSIGSGCIPLAVTFTSTSQGNVTSYHWSFPGGSPSSSTAMMPTVTYNGPGTYSAQLIVGNSVGFDTLFLADIIVVYSEVTSGFTYEIEDNVADFTNTSTGATIYNWQVDGESFGSTDLTYVFQDDGEYLVQLIATGQCGSDTTVQVIHIATAPMAGISSNATSGCEPLTVQFFNTSSSNATQFEWEFEGGVPGSSTEENPFVQYNQPGLYNVQLTVWSEGGMDVLAIDEMIEVFPMPDASFTTHQSGLQLTFENHSVNADSYEWFFGDGGTSVDPEPVYTYGDFGTYAVTLIATNACGSDSIVLNLELSSAPVPECAVTETHGCVPFEVQFLDQSQNSPEQWNWGFPGGMPASSTEQNPVVVYHQPGVYSVTLIVSNAGGMQTLVRDEYIFVDHPPVADFTSVVNSETVSFTNMSQGGTEYLWSFGDGAVDTAANPVHSYAASGTYPVQLIVTNACASDTMIYNVVVTITALDDPEAGNQIMLFPNPHRGNFNLHFDGFSDHFEITVYSALGRVVSRQTIDVAGSLTKEMYLDDPVSGFYTLVVTKPGFSRVFKMIVTD